MKICIDAGHGGRDPGAVAANGQRESDGNLKNAHALAEVMRGRGHTVLMVREGDVTVPNVQRARLANAQRCDVYCSLHQNSGPATATGVETLAAHSASKKSVQLAEQLSKKAAERMGLTLRRGNGVLRQNATVLNRTHMPANLLELGFVSNPADMRVAQQKRAELMEGLADVYELHFGTGAPLPVAGDFFARHVADRPGVADLIVPNVSGGRPIVRVEFRLYPQDRGSTALRIVPARQNSQLPQRWARRFNFAKAFGTGRRRYVIRCKAYDNLGRVSVSNAYIYADV